MSDSRNLGRFGRFWQAPMPLLLLAPVALAVLVAGAAYCMGYEELSSGRGRWGPSLLWSAYGVMPWLAAYELAKHWQQRTGRSLEIRALLGTLLATGLVSLTLEWMADAALGGGSPLALQIMRRLPPAGVTALLLLLARPRSRSAPRRSDQTLADTASLRSHAGEIRWIAAADNYLELHTSGRTMIIRLTMREAEAALAPLGFVRIHRSTLVNRAALGSIPHQGNMVELTDGTRLPVGKAFAHNLRKQGAFATSPQSD